MITPERRVKLTMALMSSSVWSGFPSFLLTALDKMPITAMAGRKNQTNPLSGLAKGGAMLSE